MMSPGTMSAMSARYHEQGDQDACHKDAPESSDSLSHCIGNGNLTPIHYGLDHQWVRPDDQHHEQP